MKPNEDPDKVFYTNFEQLKVMFSIFRFAETGKTAWKWNRFEACFL